MPKTNDERLKELAAHWNHIEGRLKKAEQSRRDVVHAAVNELRYAGRAVIDAWDASTSVNAATREEEITEKLTVAGQYLMNANHDITDGICFIFHSRVQELLEHYPRRKLKRDFPDLDEFLEKLEAANDIVTQSRSTRKERVSLYEKLEEDYIPYLLEKFAYLDYAEKMALKRQRKARWMAGFSLVVLVVGIAGSFASIVSLDGQCSIVSNAAAAISDFVPESGACEQAATVGD